MLFYVGHPAWGPGQLEDEIHDGAWLDLPASPDEVFGQLDPLALWKNALTEAGRQQVFSLFDLKHVPGEPREN